MKVWITRAWGDKTYEVWSHNELKFDGDIYCADRSMANEGLLITDISTQEAKSMFNLPRHLKKKEIAEGTMTFKVKVK